MLKPKFLFVSILTLYMFICLYPPMRGEQKDEVKEKPFGTVFSPPLGTVFSPPKLKFSKQIDPWMEFLKIRYPKLFNQQVAIEEPKEEDENAPAIVKYNAQDAIVIDIKTHNIGLYGKGIITYREFTLAAEEVMLDWTTNIITARGKKNKAGDDVGKPIFTQEEVEKDRYGKPTPNVKKRVYYSEEIQFNINSRRAIASKLVTKRDSDIIKAEHLKKDDDETFYLGKAKYTTCDLPDPHFFINTHRAKMVVDKKIVSTPFQFYFDEVPVPLGWVFGIIFLPGKRTHGIIAPEIGEDDDKGFYLKNGGYYFNFNDYATLTLKGDIYSRGEASMDNKFHYKKRYSYEGFFQYNRSFQVGTGSNQSAKKGWQFKLNHRTNSASFSADIEIHNNAYTPLWQEQYKGEKEKKDYQQTTSKVYWKPKLRKLPYRLILKGEYTCKLYNNFQTLTLPEVSLKTNSIFPFDVHQVKLSERKWYRDIYQRFQFEHNIDFTHRMSNRSLDAEQKEKKNSEEKVKYENNLQHIQNGVCHTVPIKTTISLFSYFLLQPSFTYTERWYFQQSKWKNSQSRQFIPGLFRVYDYQFKGELSTTLYTMHSFSDEAFIQGIRLTSEPSVSMTYIPDFSNNKYEYYQHVDGCKLYKYKDFVYQSIARKEREQMILNVALNNNLTLKVKKPIEEGDKENKDKTKKITILDALDLDTSYDFKEKKYPLSNIVFKICTGAITIYNNTLKFNSKMEFDPYYYENDEKTTDFAWKKDQSLGRLDKMHFEVVVNMQGKNNNNTQKQDQDMLEDISLFKNMDHTKKITNFNAPWNLEVKYNWDYDRHYTSEYENLPLTKLSSSSSKKEHKTQSFSLDGSFNLMPKWKISCTGTYNIIDKEILRESTFISINRDLHCWELAYKWWPFGYETRAKTKYEFSLGIKAESLKFLKYPRKKSYQKIKRTKK